ncbi:MAG: LamG-like jellyroll fold domain-containing protein [Bryobacteraceae bacterium]
MVQEPRVGRWRPSAKLQLLAVAVLFLAATAFLWRVGVTSAVPTVPPAFTADRLFGRVTAEGGRIRSVAVEPGSSDVLLNHSRPELYVLNRDAISVVDVNRLEVRRRIPVGYQPSDMALSPAGDYLYVGTADGLVRIEIQTGKSERFRDGLMDGPVRNLAMTPDGKRLFLAMERAGLKVIDIPGGRVRLVDAAAAPVELAMDPDGKNLYVSYQMTGPGGSVGHDAIWDFDVASEKPVSRFADVPFVGGGLAAGVTLWADGRDACLETYRRGNQRGCPLVPGAVLYVFRPQDRTLLGAFGAPPAQSFYRPAFTPDGKHVFVGGQPARVYHSGALAEEETFSLGRGHWYGRPAFDSVRRRFYFTDAAAGAVQVIDLPRTACVPPISGFRHHWAGDGNANDRIGVMPFVPLDRVAYARGLVGAAFDVAGGTLQLQARNHSAARLFSETEGTLVFWVKVSGGSATLVRYKTERGLTSWELSIEEGRLRLRMDGTDGIETRPVTPGKWQMVALSRGAGKVSVSLDGEVAGEIAEPPTVTRKTGIATLLFGPAPALLDEVMLFGRPLTLEEVRTLDRTMRTCLTGE